MQLRNAVGACVLGVALSVGSVPAATVVPAEPHRMMQACLRQAGFYQGPPTGQLDDATLQAWLAYMVARRGQAAVGQAAAQGMKGFEALGQSVGEQLGRECREGR